MNDAQTRALSVLEDALAELSRDASSSLSRAIAATQAGEPAPIWDAAGFAAVVAAMFLVEDGQRRFFTLAHLDEGKIHFRQHEELVWVAIDVQTSRSIVTHVPEAAPAKRSLFGFRSRARTSPDATMLDRYHAVRLRNAQNIAIRASYLSHYARFACERMATLTPATTFAPAPELAQKHFRNYQDAIESFAPAFEDRPAAGSMLRSLSFPTTPVVITQTADETTDELNGVPMTRAQKSAWLEYLGKLQNAE